SLTNAKFSNSAAIPTSKLGGLATSATTDTTNATNITSGSLATARVNVGTTAGKILQVDGSGNLPAIDGSLLTGIVSFTKSASDPAIDTNPSAGVGAEWVNTTSGEVYLCTDATAGANVWTNVGAGSGDIAPIPPTGNYGYIAAGSTVSPWSSDTVHRYPFASDANSSDWADLERRTVQGGHSSATDYGYIMKGNDNTTSPTWIAYVQKFSFASGGTGTNVGNSTENAQNYGMAGTGDIPGGYGYALGGYSTAGEHGGNNWESETIERYAYASDGNASDHGNLKYAAYTNAGSFSSTHGYSIGGGNYYNTYFAQQPFSNLGWQDCITKFAFSSNSLGTDVGNIGTASTYVDATQNASYAWRMGGADQPGKTNRIERIPFSSDGNSTDVADLTVARSNAACASSGTNGYYAGGEISWPNFSTNLDKFNFSSQGNSTDVADATHRGHGTGGHQSGS
ncbi:uncharacterized protein METZ01_LOCUS85026, partial [marine metagenome]